MVDLSYTIKLIAKYKKTKGSLIPLLHDIQKIYGYVPHESIELVAKEFAIYPVKIYEVLTFYTQFYLSPRGKHIIKVCQGTACHVMGGKEIFNYLSIKLGIHEGETTKDELFSLDKVFCLGCCGMAPVVVIDDEFVGNCTLQQFDTLLARYDGGDRVMLRSVVQYDIENLI